LITRSLGTLLDVFARRKMGQTGSREALIETQKAMAIYRKSLKNSDKMLEKRQNSLINSENTEGVVLRDILPDEFPFLLETESFLRQYQPNNAWILREKAVSDALKRDDFLLKNREKGDGINAQTKVATGVDSDKKTIDKIGVNQNAGTTQNGDFFSQKGQDTEGPLADEKPLTFIETGRDEVTNEILDDAVGFEGEEARPEGRATDAEVTELYVTNAGLVLLHPFLSRLFDNLGLTNDGIFVDKQLKDKALTVLHYLATGETRALEYHLMLPKLLCQMPFNQPVRGHWVLSDEEKTTCDGLLEVAIEYWSALGKTSPEGLREAFLQRKGKLIHRPSGWLLQVERTTIDVLVDRLPWGLGVVKLPWMRDFMTVEW
jgi:Contractile injection system tape measure protein